MLTSVFLFHQPPRHQSSVVPHSIQGHKKFDLQSVQMADHQDSHRTPVSGYFGYFPLQHAWLHGQENDGSLRGTAHNSNISLVRLRGQLRVNPWLPRAVRVMVRYRVSMGPVGPTGCRNNGLSEHPTLVDFGKS